MFDNTLNRVIKYVSRILQKKTRFDDTNLKLNEIVFILDEVEDMVCTIKDLNSIKLNSFFTDYQYVIDICRMVLEQQVYNNEHYEQSQWCLLFPMEYVFEDFVAGFLEAHFSDRWVVHFQKSDLNLSSDPPAFQMRHDILITSRSKPERKIIIDTKYKIRHPESRNDAKKGIAQSDMYQMTSYALRRGCHEVLLLYPNYAEALQPIDIFMVESGFDAQHKINIIAAEIPFWSMLDFPLLTEKIKLTFNRLLTIH
jgi:5-methylcytosine-specific restriction enzyme subunit McrC